MGEAAVRIVTLTESELRNVIREELRQGQPAPSASDWMTSQEVASMLNVARSTIPALVSRDLLPCYRPGKKGYAFLRSEVDAWLRERAHRPRAKTKTKRLARGQG